MVITSHNHFNTIKFKISFRVAFFPFQSYPKHRSFMHFRVMWRVDQLGIFPNLSRDKTWIITHCTFSTVHTSRMDFHRINMHKRSRSYYRPSFYFYCDISRRATCLMGPRSCQTERQGLLRYDEMMWDDLMQWRDKYFKWCNIERINRQVSMYRGIRGWNPTAIICRIDKKTIKIRKYVLWVAKGHLQLSIHIYALSFKLECLQSP